ncbi:DUF1827 family protein [Niabella hibiscisoli]|uniref:DUF1827 family protein n=1 Tax=Niabella hibiscisoli TaxID=1825928 RepID=UPI001F1156FA|nr:DUF1827 family protein [Niabella hibiscisoli]MCH5718139.1 DUF1827 family protein [Niabella hibiscisoli]
MTYQELVNNYNNYSDEQLLEVYDRLGDYSSEAKEALFYIVKGRGGIDILLKNKEEKLRDTAEIERIQEEVMALKKVPFDLDFLSQSISSDSLNEAQIKDVIQNALEEKSRDIEDRKLKPRTFIAGIPAAILATILAGIMWGLQLMWSGRMFLIILIGVILLCYGTIKAFTKQSYKNAAVITLTIISTLMALLMGQVMFEVFGRQ